MKQNKKTQTRSVWTCGKDGRRKGTEAGTSVQARRGRNPGTHTTQKWNSQKPEPVIDLILELAEEKNNRAQGHSSCSY